MISCINNFVFKFGHLHLFFYFFIFYIPQCSPNDEPEINVWNTYQHPLTGSNVPVTILCACWLVDGVCLGSAGVLQGRPAGSARGDEGRQAGLPGVHDPGSLPLLCRPEGVPQEIREEVRVAPLPQNQDGGYFMIHKLLLTIC